MILNSFDRILEKARGFETAKRVAVVGSETEHVLEGVFDAQREGVVYPVLIGNREKTVEMIKRLGYENEKYTMIDSIDGINPSQMAVDLINKGEADFPMKGLIETSDFLRPILDRKNNLNIGRTMSLFTLADMKTYPKLLAITDGGINVKPDLEAKKNIVLNTVDTLNLLGCENPKVAMICATEVVNPKQQDTLEAAELVKMWSSNSELTRCELVGPISYDLAVSKESAEIKGFDCKWSGEFDALVMPNIVAANALIKALIINGGAICCGMVVGARVPIALSTRSASRDDKFRSLAICAAACSI